MCSICTREYAGGDQWPSSYTAAVNSNLWRCIQAHQTMDRWLLMDRLLQCFVDSNGRSTEWVSTIFVGGLHPNFIYCSILLKMATIHESVGATKMNRHWELSFIQLKFVISHPCNAPALQSYGSACECRVCKKISSLSKNISPPLTTPCVQHIKSGTNQFIS